MSIACSKLRRRSTALALCSLLLLSSAAGRADTGTEAGICDTLAERLEALEGLGLEGRLARLETSLASLRDPVSSAESAGRPTASRELASRVQRLEQEARRPVPELTTSRLESRVSRLEGRVNRVESQVQRLR